MSRHFVTGLVLAFAFVLGPHLVPSVTHAGAREPLPQKNGFDVDVPDLKCPGKRPRKSIVPSSQVDFDMPSAGELGGLGMWAERPAPGLEPSRLLGFELPSPSVTGEATPRRIAFWGDSHLAAGVLTGELRRLLDNRGLKASTRFLPATVGRRGIRLPVRSVCVGSSWKYDLAYLDKSPAAYAPGLVNLRATGPGPSAYLWIDFRDAKRQAHLRSIRVLYRPTTTAALMVVSVNDSPNRPIRLSPGSVSGVDQIASFVVEAPSLVSTLKMRVTEGKVVLQGFILEEDQPTSITIDEFGLPSSTASGFAASDPMYLADALLGETYDAVVLQYGTNEGNVRVFDRATYAAGFERAISNLRRAFPGASCLLIGPGDRGVLAKRRRTKAAPLDLLKFSRVHEEISSVQAEVGARFGCEFWDWQSYMGGPGASYAWAREVPPLMGRDLTHFTIAGQRRTADAIAQSLGWYYNPEPLEPPKR